MNVNQIVNMIIRMFFRKAMSRGIDAGIDRLSGSGKKKGGPDQSPEARETAKRAKQAVRISRKIGRM